MLFALCGCVTLTPSSLAADISVVMCDMRIKGSAITMTPTAVPFYYILHLRSEWLKPRTANQVLLQKELCGECMCTAHSAASSLCTEGAVQAKPAVVYTGFVQLQILTCMTADAGW